MDEKTAKENKNKDYIKYQVIEGDTLESIAEKFKIKVETIKEVNSLESDDIVVGQELLIPSDDNKTRIFMTVLFISLFLVIVTGAGLAIMNYIERSRVPDCDKNCDTDGDGVCDWNCYDEKGNCYLNCDTTGNGKCDKNCDTTGSGKCDWNCYDTNGKCVLNCDTDSDGKCDLNCDTNGDGKCDKNCDTDSDGKCDWNCYDENDKCVLNCDTNGDGKCDKNCDTNDDEICDWNCYDENGKCILNCDLNGDGICDLNCDTDGDGDCDKLCDDNGDGICDRFCEDEIPPVNPNEEYIINYIDGGNLSVTVGPGWTGRKTFQLKNESNTVLKYSIKWINVTNTYSQDNNLYFGLIRNGTTLINRASNKVPYSEGYMIENLTLPAKTTYTHTVEFEFRETGINQDKDRDKTFRAFLKIEVGI